MRTQANKCRSRDQAPPTLFEMPQTARKADKEPLRVRRGSCRAGAERAFYRPIDRADIGFMFNAAWRYNCEHKSPGDRIGPLGEIGLKVWEYLLHRIDYKTGRLEPAIKTIAERVKCSGTAVVDALKRLKAAGFLDWWRRYEPTDREGKGPQVRQITNAYRLTLPPRAQKLASRFLMRPAPSPKKYEKPEDIYDDPNVPDDAATAFVEARAAVEAMRQSGMTEHERSLETAYVLTDDPLRESALRLAAAIANNVIQKNGEKP